MKIINSIRFSELNLWDVKRFNYKFNQNFENAILLRNILIPYKQKVTKQELVKNDWRIIAKINFQGELFLREKEEIETYKGSLNKVPENSIIYSKINVRHGCVYFHEKRKTPFGVSTEYPIFTFDEKKVNGHYLKIVLRSEEFKKLLNTKTSGISKARVKIDEFLDIQIPLPNIETQNLLVANYNSKIEQSRQQENQAQVLKLSIDDYLYTSLGVKKQKEKGTLKGIYLVGFKNIDRWDIWTNKSSIESTIFDNKKFEFIVKEKPQYGANVKGIKKESDVRYIRITDINEAGYLNDEFVSPAKVEEKYLLQENDFLIARSGNTVGKTLLYKEKFGKAIYAGYLVKYTIDYSIIDPEYLSLFTKSFIFKKWIESNQRVSGQPNINGQEFLQAPLILPPLLIQKEIASHISKLRNQVRELYTKAEQNRKLAIQEFEQEIFS